MCQPPKYCAFIQIPIDFFLFIVHNIHIDGTIDLIKKGWCFMEIAGISIALSALQSVSSSSSVSAAASMKMLDNSLEMGEQLSAGMVKMMENSVTPQLGGNIDISI